MAKCKDCQYYGDCFLNRRSADADVTGCKVYEVKRDFVEVVRCKDCKHYFHYGDCIYGCRTFGMLKTKPEGFCSQGERRDNGTA